MVSPALPLIPMDFLTHWVNLSPMGRLCLSLNAECCYRLGSRLIRCNSAKMFNDTWAKRQKWLVILCHRQVNLRSKCVIARPKELGESIILLLKSSRFVMICGPLSRAYNESDCHLYFYLQHLFSLRNLLNFIGKIWDHDRSGLQESRAFCSGTYKEFCLSKQTCICVGVFFIFLFLN